MSNQIHVTEANFSTVLEQVRHMPVVFHFTAPSNPEAADLDRVIRQLASEYAEDFLLATVNCETDPMIALQFNVQQTPALYLFKEGKALDAIVGFMRESELRERLSVLLPTQSERDFKQALNYIESQNFSAAAPLLKTLWEAGAPKSANIGLLYAETLLMLNQIDAAETCLAQFLLEDRDSRWKGLMDKIELLKQASESPELQQLQQAYADAPSAALAIRLATQLHQAHKNDEALMLLLSYLKQDLNAENGEVKAQYLTILSALGNSDPLTASFRRQLYSLIY